MDAATINHLLLIGAILVAASIMVSSVANKIGVPILVIFLGVGMFAGIDGRQRRAKPGTAHHGRKRDLRGVPRPHGGIPGIAVQNPGAKAEGFSVVRLP